MSRKSLLAGLPVLLAALALFAPSGWAQGQEPRMLRDLDPRFGPGYLFGPAGVSGFRTFGPVAAFWLTRGNASQGGAELWASDGTTSGTRMVLHAEPAVEPSTGYEPWAGRLPGVGFFYTTEVTGAGRRYAFWRTDGTPAGTFPLATGLQRTATFASQVVAHRGKGYLSLCAESGCEPWITDGTRGGTRLLRDLTPGPFGSDPCFVAPAEEEGPLRLLAHDPEGPGLWSTDGTRGGTVRSTSLPVDSRFDQAFAVPGRIFFLTWSLTNVGPTRVWSSDGTPAGTRPLRPFDRALRPRSRWLSLTQPLGPLGPLGLFVLSDSGGPPQLWRSDGTDRGTFPLTSLAGGFTQLAPAMPGSDRAVFSDSRGRLWSTRGTAASTAPLFACDARCPVQLSDPLYISFAPVAGKVYFTGRSAGSGAEPWITDGTPAGTLPLGDLCPGPCDSTPAPRAFTGDRLGLVSQQSGLWLSDGTAAGTRPILAPRRGWLSSELALAGGSILFVADGDAGQRLWRSDSTPAGTQPLLRLSNGASSYPNAFVPLGSGVLFAACQGDAGGLWGSQGDAESTLPFAETYCSHDEQRFQRAGEEAFFLQFPRDGDYTYELWRTDGTAAGTQRINLPGAPWKLSSIASFGPRLLARYRPEGDEGEEEVAFFDPRTDSFGPPLPLGGSRPIDTARLGDRLYLTTQDLGEGPRRLWRTDGTPAGTLQLAVIDPAYTVFFRDPVSLGGVDYFVLSDFSSPRLWRSDGTPAGTRAVLPHRELPELGVNPMGLTAAGGRLFLLTQRTDEFGDTVLTLVAGDGTPAGSFVVRAFPPDSLDACYGPSNSLVALGPVVYFLGCDAEHGLELWRSDGTPAGTRIVTDLAPGPRSAEIEGLVVAGGRLAFSADDGVHGRELWLSDGTAGGTRMVADLAPEALSSAPTGMTEASGNLYWSADDGVNGREPWILPLEDLPP